MNSTRPPCEPLERQQIEHKLKDCACLPSLGSIDSALKQLLGDEDRYTSQIAEIIRRDPSLTARLLRLVNSVHYGFSKTVKSIEEAVFYLGMRRIRQLAMVTPIIEDFRIMASHTRLEWRGFWRHCIATALMTREVIDQADTNDAEIDYVGGLIHDVGKITMASTFPDHFAEIYIHRTEADMELMELEREVLGIDHAELGAMYLRNQALPEVFAEVVQFHHNPSQAPNCAKIAAAVQVADKLVHEAKIGFSGRLSPLQSELWVQTEGWNLLFSHQNEEESAATRIRLKNSLKRVPATLEGLV